MKTVKTTTGCIIEKSGKVLIQKRNHEPYYDHWCCPGGHIDIGETPKQAIIREVKEEVGLDVNPRFLHYYNEYDKSHDWHAVALLFHATIDNSQEINFCKKEVKQTKWVDKSDFKNYKYAFVYENILDNYFNNRIGKQNSNNIIIDRGRINKIISLSKQIGNDPEKFIDMIKHHGDEIKELFEKNDKHFAVETGDLIILCIELLLDEGYSVQEILEQCYGRFDKKINKLLLDKK